MVDTQKMWRTKQTDGLHVVGFSWMDALLHCIRERKRIYSVALILCVLLFGLSSPSVCGSPWRAQDTACKYSSEATPFTSAGCKCRFGHRGDDSPRPRTPQTDPSYPSWSAPSSPASSLWSPVRENPTEMSFNWFWESYESYWTFPTEKAERTAAE